MLEGIICPACENTLEEVDLQESLVCPHCRTDLKDRRYLDFREFEKKKDHYNIYENELLPEDKTDENIKEYSQFEGLNDEWEDFNERDFENSG